MAQLKDLTVTGNSVFNGTVTLNADPTTAMQAATKQYVDNHSGGSVTVFTTHDYQPTISGSPASGYDISGTLPQGFYQAMVDATSSGFPVFIDNEGDFDVGDAALRTYYYNGLWTTPNPAYIELVGLPECDSHPQEIWVLHIFNGDTFGIIKLQYGNVAYGNITTSGTISDGNVSVATNDSFLIRDNSDSGKIVSSSLKFNTSATGEERFLSEKGRWGVPTGWVSSWSSDELALQIDGTPSTGTIMSGSVYQGCYNDITGGQLDWYVGIITDGDGLFTAVPYHTYYYAGFETGASADFIRYISYDAANSRFILLTIDSGDYFKITAIATGGGGSSVWVESSNTAYYPDTTSPTMSVDSTNDIATVNGDLNITTTDSTFATTSALKFNAASSKTFQVRAIQSGQGSSIDWNGDGPALEFLSKDASTNASMFALKAGNSTAGYKELRGFSGGTLVWDNRRVVTATNSSAVGSTTQPVYIDSSGYPQLVTEMDTTKLKNPPIETSGVEDTTYKPLINNRRANHLAFLPANQIIIEQTIDGGTTWTDAGISDANKVGLFSELRPAIYLPLVNGEVSALGGLRITFSPMNYAVPSGVAETNKYSYWHRPDTYDTTASYNVGDRVYVSTNNYVIYTCKTAIAAPAGAFNSTYWTASSNTTERYCSLSNMYFWLSVANTGVAIGVKFEVAKSGTPDTWTTIFNSDSYNTAMAGWSGGNCIKFSNTIIGGSLAQTNNNWNCRLTFFPRTTSGGSDIASGLTGKPFIQEIRGFGDNWWSTINASSAYASVDHLYRWDYTKNATFPAKVTVGTAPTADMDVATKKYVDDAVASGGNEYVIEVPATVYAGASPPLSGDATVFTAAKTAMQAGKKVYIKIRSEQVEGSLGSLSNWTYHLMTGYHEESSTETMVFMWSDYFNSSMQNVKVLFQRVSGASMFWSINVDTYTAASGVSF